MSKNIKKMIAIDLDGTLLTREKRISPRTKHALQEAAAEGHHVVIATGRPVHASMGYYEELGLNTPMVNFNGALVHHAKDDAWGHHHFPLDRETALGIIEVCEQFQVENVIAEIKDDYYMRTPDPDFVKFICGGRAPLAIGHIPSLLGDHPTSILVRGNEGKIHQMRKHLSDVHADVIEHRLWGAPWNVIEMTKAGVNKAMGLELIAESLGVAVRDVIAFGDEDNDMEMIQFAGVGVAMGNANRDLKEAADRVTGTNDEDGIAQVLEQLL